MLSAVLPPPNLLAVYVVAAAVLTLTPGPDMTLFVAKTVGQSRSAGFSAAAGAFTGLFVHTTLVAVGLAALLAASITAFTVLKIAGAAYLVWLGYRAVRFGSGFTPVAGRIAPEPLRRIYGKGLTANLLNPKIILFFVTFLPQFVVPGEPHVALRLLMLGLLFVIVALPITAAIILAADGLATRIRRSPRLLRGIDFLFAGVMGAFAVKLLASNAS